MHELFEDPDYNEQGLLEESCSEDSSEEECSVVE